LNGQKINSIVNEPLQFLINVFNINVKVYLSQA